MDAIYNNHPRFERSGFAAAALVIGALLLAVGLAPRNERALFLRDDSGVPVKAFTAVVAPLDAMRAQLERGALDGIGAMRRSRSVSDAVSPGSRGADVSGTPLLPGTIPALISNAPRAVGADSLDDTGAAAGGGSPSGAAPAPTGGNPAAGTGEPTPGGGVPAPELQTPTTGAPGLAPVPEPATWLMLLIGFFGIGGMIRRPLGRRRATAVEVFEPGV